MKLKGSNANNQTTNDHARSFHSDYESSGNHISTNYWSIGVMKREIKFRCFAHASKEMFYPDSEDGWEISRGEVTTVPNTTIMQFTGLHDKNGVEIYEGDIVSCYDRFNERIDFVGEVFYNTKLLMYDFKNKSGHTKRYRNHPTLDYKVVGNVYQNPELLE